MPLKIWRWHTLLGGTDRAGQNGGMPSPHLTIGLAGRLARAALGHVSREYPNKLDHILTGPGDLQAPRVLHPVFFGSFDWHSCVHGFWLLARLRALFPDLPENPAITALFADRLIPAAVAGECAYLEGKMRGGFERPYGWAWLLMLQAELARGDARAGQALQPLTDAIVARFSAYLAKADYPIRAGTHTNTAFALLLALDSADEAGHGTLATAARLKAAAWYGGDADCQAWEPNGEDFLSPALIEALCMSRALESDAWENWFRRFLPRLGEGEPTTLFRPVSVSDRADGRMVHLDGLNLSRAWCWRTLAAQLAPDDPRRRRALAAIDTHLAASLPAITGDYMGEHWLASFALLALECPATLTA